MRQETLFDDVLARFSWKNFLKWILLRNGKFHSFDKNIIK
jgi:hypothetical protein